MFLNKVNSHSCLCWLFPYFICCHSWYSVFSHSDSDHSGPQQKNHLSLCYTEQPVTYIQECPSFPMVGQWGHTGGCAASHFSRAGLTMWPTSLMVCTELHKEIIYHNIACPLLQGVLWLLQESTQHPQDHRDFPKIHVISPMSDHDSCDLAEDTTELWVHCTIQYRNNITKYKTRSLAKTWVI